MKTRATLIIKGDVQEAGYRATILRIALKLGVVGFVENLKNGNVKIVCEGDNIVIKKFIEQIRVKDEYVLVEDIEKKFEKFTGEFETFEIKTGDLAFEMFQGYATAGKYFHGLGKKVEQVGNKVECVGDKVEQVGEHVKQLREETKNNFNYLRDSYHIFSKILISVDENLKRIGGNQEESNKRFERMYKEQTKLVGAIRLLVKESVKKRK